MTVTVYGASDDLIEIDGDIHEEFSHYSSGEEGDPALLAFSDGTVLRIVHDSEGMAHHPVVQGTATLTHTFGQDDREHTDKATLDGDIRWVVYGQEMAVKR